VWDSDSGAPATSGKVATWKDILFSNVVFSKDLIVYRSDMNFVKKRIVAGGQKARMSRNQQFAVEGRQNSTSCQALSSFLVVLYSSTRVSCSSTTCPHSPSTEVLNVLNIISNL
jgi:hypothetical protein